MVTDEKSLRDVCATLRAAGTFGFDTEFIRERSYEPQLCLIQVAAPGMVAIIDPLAVDVGAFWELVIDGELTKVVHAGDQDLEICYLHTKRVPANIFDVQAAAAMVGMDYPLSYTRLVRRVLSVQLSQSESFSEWAQRPLSESQIRYAIEDVTYLVALREHLTAELVARGRQDWFAEEMSRYEKEDLYSFDPSLAWRRVRGRKQLTRRQLAILRELAAWRESAAQGADVPTRTFLRDEVLAMVARRTPSSVGELQATRGFPRPLAARHGKAILQAIEKGREAPLKNLPHPLEPNGVDHTDKMLVDLLSVICRSLCISGGLCPGLLAGRSDCAEVVGAMRRAYRDSEGVRMLNGWRYEFAGGVLKEVLAGNRKIRIVGTGRNINLEVEQAD